MRGLTIQLRTLGHAFACLASVAMCTVAFAQPGGSGSQGGGAGGPHGSGGGVHGGGGHYASSRAPSSGQTGHATSAVSPSWNATHGHGSYGSGRGGYSHGYRSGYRGYGWYPGYSGYGWYPGYGFYGGYGWGALAFGAFVPVLPAYYQTFWWGGAPYYYADDTYYRWDAAATSYEVVPPPVSGAYDGAPSDASAAGAAPAPELYAYPQRGQPPEQLAKDRYECHRWAADQTGFDPTRPAGGVAPAEASARAGTYRRAEAACLTGRGYSVR